MADITDFLFGKKALVKAASTGTPATPAVKTPAGIDVAAQAQADAAKKLKKKKTDTAPVPVPTNAQTIQKQFLAQ